MDTLVNVHRYGVPASPPRSLADCSEFNEYEKFLPFRHSNCSLDFAVWTAPRDSLVRERVQGSRLETW